MKFYWMYTLLRFNYIERIKKLFTSLIFVISLSFPFVALGQQFVFEDSQGSDELDQGSDGGGTSQYDLTASSNLDNAGNMEVYFDQPNAANGSFSYCSYFEDLSTGEFVAFCVDINTDNEIETIEVFDCDTDYSHKKNLCEGGNPSLNTDYAMTCEIASAESIFDESGDSVDDDDMLLTCNITGEYANLEFINTCSKPSASPTSNSNDCIFNETGFIKLVKVVNNGSASESDFTLKIDSFEVDGASETNAVAIPVDATQSPFVLTEVTADKYEQVSLTCVGEADSTPVALTGSADNELSLEAGETVVCTFTNEIPFGELTIVKKVDNTYGGDKDANDFFLWAAPASGGDYVLSGNPTPDGDLSADISSSEIEPDVYVVGESGSLPDGYELISIVCDNQPSSQVTVAAEGDHSCTIENRSKRAKLTLRKVVDGYAPVPAETSADYWKLEANLDGGTAEVSGYDTGGGVTEDELVAGSYGLTEVNPTSANFNASDWNSADWDCGSTVVTGSTITLNNGDDVTCTVINTYTPERSVYVKKLCEGSSDGTSKDVDCDTNFTVTLYCGGSIRESRNITPSDEGSLLDFGNYEADSECYVVEDPVPTPWAVTYSHSSTSPLVVATDDSQNIITVTNTRPLAKLSSTVNLRKYYSSGTDVFDLSIVHTGHIDDPAVSGQLGNFDITNELTLELNLGDEVDEISGEFSISESNLSPNYQIDSVICSYSSSTGNVSLAPSSVSSSTDTDGNVTVTYNYEAEPGIIYFCAVTNSPNYAELQLIKIVKGGDGYVYATLAPEDCSLSALDADGNGLSGDGSPEPDVGFESILSGVYTLSENCDDLNADRYLEEDWVCTGAASSTGSSVTLVGGNQATCTVTNVYTPICETAFAAGTRGFRESKISKGRNGRWGWVIDANVGEDIGPQPIMAGAPDENTDADDGVGSQVGTYEIVWNDDGTVTIKVVMQDGWVSEGFHLYFGEGPLRKTAPGSYNANGDSGDWVYNMYSNTWSRTIDDPDLLAGVDGEFLIVLHMETCM